jgi:hypothetical protein
MSIYWVLNLLAWVVAILLAISIAALVITIIWILYYEIKDRLGDDDE